MTKKFRDVFRRIRSISTPIGGISWQPPDSVAQEPPALQFPITRMPKPQIGPTSPLRLVQILEGQPPDSSSRLFDVTIGNPTEQQLVLTEFEMHWCYHHGMCCSIDHGVPLMPVAEYVIKLPIDADTLLERHAVQVLYPPLAVPPRNASGPSMTTIRLQLHYHFAGRIDWHPCSDWDIVFSVDVHDDGSGSLPIFSDTSWRASCRG